MISLFIRGVGLWTPGFPSAEAWCRGAPDAEVKRPSADLLTGPLKRRSSEVTRMAIETYLQAAHQADCDPSRAPTIWATAHGEHSTALRLLGMMHKGEGKLSPAHFHNSVHNTPSGYASIAARNMAPSTTLTGGSELVPAALLEAICLTRSLKSDTLLIFADEALRHPFDVPGASQPLAIAFCLSQQRQGSLAQISTPRRNGAGVAPNEHFGFLHVSTALPLLEAVSRRKSGRISLEFEPEKKNSAWAVEVEPVSD